MNRMVREQAKARHATTRQETSSDDDEGTNPKYEHCKAMATYHLANIPQGHTMKVEKMEPLARRAKSGQKKRGLYIIPGDTTEFMPQWMKGPLPKKIEDIPTHAHWVAGWWGKALAQIASQGHVGWQSLSIEQLLTQFLNANRLCIEKSQKVGWHAENENWLSAVEATRRVDKTFDINEHFLKFREEDVAEGQKALDAATKAASKTPTGKGSGNTATSGEPFLTVYRPQGAGKGKYKSAYKSYYDAEYYKGYCKGGKYGQFGKNDKGKYGKPAVPWLKTKVKDDSRGKVGKWGKTKSDKKE